MTAMKAYLTYALRGDALVHIDDVPNGNGCGCICPHCKRELCAKNGGSGESKVHHFAHLSGADCVGAVESALHKMAKDVMKETMCIQLPDRNDGKRGELLKLDRVEVEFYDKDTQLRPDCIGYYGDKVIWIEFKRTHAVDAKKKGKIISKKIDCVELDLNGCALKPDAVRKFITEDTEKRIWIRDTESKPRQAGKASRYGSCYDGYTERRVERLFAKDENGALVNLLDDAFDANEHTYYCLACGKEVSIDVDEIGSYSFTHIEQARCEDDLYLYEAAKAIIQHKFLTSSKFEIVVPQNQHCAEKDNCIFYQKEACTYENDFPYNLKEHGYTECLKDCKVPNYSYKCDLVIKTSDSLRNAIIISIDAGDCHVDVDTKEYRVIEIGVFDASSLMSLLSGTVGGYRTSFLNFVEENKQPASRTKVSRRVLKFTLYSSGKYYLEPVPCAALGNRRRSAVLEHLFVHGIDNYDDARWYSLLKCYEQKRKACYCEICWFHAKPHSMYGPAKTICKRYKTKGTPHFPLDSMPIDCPYFRIDKEIESMIKLTYEKAHVIEKKYEA